MDKTINTLSRSILITFATLLLIAGSAFAGTTINGAIGVTPVISGQQYTNVYSKEITDKIFNASL